MSAYNMFSLVIEKYFPDTRSYPEPCFHSSLGMTTKRMCIITLELKYDFRNVSSLILSSMAKYM